MKKAIIIFTRVPIPGQTKTRMMPALTAVQCAKLHTCFIKDIKKQCEACAADIFVCFTPEDKEQRLRKIFDAQCSFFLQTGDGLGERMYNALEAVFQKGYEKCLLIGTDVPELKASYLERAFYELRTKDVVFGRTKDGGYYLVGMNEARKEVFEIPKYGHAGVWTDTIRHLDECGLQTGYTGSLQDMDTAEDLNAYRKRMRTQKELRMTMTGRYLIQNRKISIVVPLYNEEKTVEVLQEQLKKLKDRCEILFVDGGSTDRTLDLIRPEFKVIHTVKGRAKQMNIGARESTGEILFFLHCDSKLPSNPLTKITNVMREHEAGCFGIAFETKSPLMQICRVISNHRIKDRKVMFGDQGIFIERSLFFEVGMYPDLPIMEDYQFSLTLKEKGIQLGMAKGRIYTSDRRFPKGTISKLKLMWKMNRLRKMYRDGVDIRKIAVLYKDIR